MSDPETDPRIADFIDHVRAGLADVMPEDLAGRVRLINELRALIHEHSPFASEPVDFVRWVPSEVIHGNDYNPNSVAPPEMELLRISIASDGYTQPIVAMKDGDEVEVIDGFHRHRVGKEAPDIRARVHGYLPIVDIRSDRKSKADRMAATVRHNRARGKHQVSAMSEMVIELRRRNWSNDKIARELGMEADEVLRLCQLTGIIELFADDDFSASWDVDDLPPSDDEALAAVAALIAEDAPRA